MKSIDALSDVHIEQVVQELVNLRQRPGRLFIGGSGGGAGHASHAAADFRRLTSIESYAISDNVSELTALINDESWEESYAYCLAQSNFGATDNLMIMSVGGGDLEKSVSINLINAAKYCKSRGGKVIAIASNLGGYLGKHADFFISIPVPESNFVTPICESLQALIWHLIVTHPELKMRKTHWESLGGVR